MYTTTPLYVSLDLSSFTGSPDPSSPDPSLDPPFSYPSTSSTENPQPTQRSQIKAPNLLHLGLATWPPAPIMTLSNLFRSKIFTPLLFLLLLSRIYGILRTLNSVMLCMMSTMLLSRTRFGPLFPDPKWSILLGRCGFSPQM